MTSIVKVNKQPLFNRTSFLSVEAVQVINSNTVNANTVSPEYRATILSLVFFGVL